jgi:hypothetical protein
MLYNYRDCSLVFIWYAFIQLKMPIKNVLITLAVSVAVAAYLFYAMIPVPADIEQKDEIFWIFAKRKVSRGLVSAC